MSTPSHKASAIAPIVGELSKNSFLVSRHMLCDLLAAYELIAIVTSGLLSRYIYLVVYRGVETPILEYISLILVVSIFFQLVARHTRIYNPITAEDFLSHLYAVIYVWAATFSMTFIMLFFIKASDFYSRLWFIYWSAIFLAFVILGRGVFAKQVRRLARAGALRRPIALIGEGSQFLRVKEALLHDEQHFRLTNVLELRGGFAQERDLRGFIDSVRRNEVPEVLIALPSSRAASLDTVVGQLQALAANIHIVPDLGSTKIPLMQLQHAGDFAYITTVSKPIEGWGVFQKRVEDIIVASIGLALTLPAMLLIALAIKLNTKGPVIFRQRRHGYNHRVIQVLKFRTMTVLEDGDVVSQAKKVDKRVTRVGWVLRRTSLDELPQLINVLRGDMSIVGPRPHALVHNSYYEDLVQNYANRHRVKPGITGWAQIHGFRGETETPEKMAERVRFDLEYIENWSIWLDLKIIVMTLPCVLFQKSAY